MTPKLAEYQTRGMAEIVDVLEELAARDRLL